MNKLKFLSILSMALLLGACGSDSDCDGSISGGCETAAGEDPVAATVSTIDLIANAVQLPSGGNDPIELTAIVSDANSGAVSGVTVQFSANGDTGARLIPSVVETDAAGLARVMLSTLNPENRAVTVSVSSGEISSQTITIDVIGTAITVTGSESLVLGDQAKYNLLLTDSDGAALGGQVVSLVSANGNELADENGTPLADGTLTTKADGSLIFQLAADGFGSDTVTASSLGASFVKNVEISDDSFSIVSPAQAEEITLGTTVDVTARWIENEAPVVGKTLLFFSARGSLSSVSAVTDSNGEATVTISSTDAGISELTVIDSEALASATNEIEFVAENADFMSLQPDIFNVTTGATTKIEATVYEGNNLVKNKTIVFSVEDSTGGTVSPLTAITDSNGVAITSYRAGPTTSATDGVTVNAYVLGTSSVNADVNLTVAGQVFRFDIGTGNSIESLSSTLYAKEYSIVVTDGNSNAVSNSQIQVSAPPLQFRKGIFVKGISVWVQDVAATCDAEDKNRDGIIDNVDTPDTEDLNGNGVLDPSNVVSVVGIDANAPLDAGCANLNDTGESSTVVQTNNGGIARVCLIYNKDKAYWARIDMTATAGVSGTESSENVRPWLTGAAADYNSLAVAPPGDVSPFGREAGCDSPL
jgi:hypothetical protein